MWANSVGFTCLRRPEAEPCLDMESNPHLTSKQTVPVAI
jgi:hypothetical protein